MSKKFGFGAVGAEVHVWGYVVSLSAGGVRWQNNLRRAPRVDGRDEKVTQRSRRGPQSSQRREEQRREEGVAELVCLSRNTRNGGIKRKASEVLNAKTAKSAKVNAKVRRRGTESSNSVVHAHLEIAPATSARLVIFHLPRPTSETRFCTSRAARLLFRASCINSMR